MSRRPVRESVVAARSPGDTGTPPETTDRAADRTADRSGDPAAPGSAIVGGHEPNTTIGALRGLVTVSGRLVLAAPRGRGVPSIDVVEFVAACPACGKDVAWIEEREETRLRIIIECPCARSPGVAGTAVTG